MKKSLKFVSVDDNLQALKIILIFFFEDLSEIPIQDFSCFDQNCFNLGIGDTIDAYCKSQVLKWSNFKGIQSTN